MAGRAHAPVHRFSVWTHWGLPALRWCGIDGTGAGHPSSGMAGGAGASPNERNVPSGVAVLSPVRGGVRRSIRHAFPWRGHSRLSKPFRARRELFWLVAGLPGLFVRAWTTDWNERRDASRDICSGMSSGSSIGADRMFPWRLLLWRSRQSVFWDRLSAGLDSFCGIRFDAFGASSIVRSGVAVGLVCCCAFSRATGISGWRVTDCHGSGTVRA